MGQRVGRLGSVEAFTEVTFRRQPNGDKTRPDGLLVLDTSRRQWKAIVEAKIGSSRINPDQIRRYYRLARANGIDAIITISNELNVKPGCLPYDVSPEILRNIELLAIRADCSQPSYE